MVTKTVYPQTIKTANSYHKLGSNPATNTTLNSFVDGYTRNWSLTPNFFELKKKKAFIPPRDYYFVRTSEGILFGHCNVYNIINTFIEGTVGVCVGTNTTPGWIPAISKCGPNGLYAIYQSRLNSALLPLIKDQKVNLAQVFAERSLTAELVTSTAITLAKTFSDLKRGNLVGAVKTLTGSPPPKHVKNFWKKYGPINIHTNPQGAKDRAANTWLQLQYGWKPLLQDVYGSAELCAQSLQRSRVTKVSTKQKYKSYVQNIYHVGLSGNLVATENYYDTFSCKQSCSFSVESAAARSMSEIGVSNPLALAWELLPYSFVVDWFLPIGPWLGNIDATAGLTLNSRVISYAYHHWCEFVCSPGSNAGDQYDVDMSARPEIWEYGRDTFGTFPNNPLPEFKNPFSMTHCLNALALLGQVFGK